MGELLDIDNDFHEGAEYDIFEETVEDSFYMTTNLPRADEKEVSLTTQKNSDAEGPLKLENVDQMDINGRAMSPSSIVARNKERNLSLIHPHQVGLPESPNTSTRKVEDEMSPGSPSSYGSLSPHASEEKATLKEKKSRPAYERASSGKIVSNSLFGDSFDDYPLQRAKASDSSSSSYGAMGSILNSVTGAVTSPSKNLAQVASSWSVAIEYFRKSTSTFECINHLRFLCELLDDIEPSDRLKYCKHDFECAVQDLKTRHEIQMATQARANRKSASGKFLFRSSKSEKSDRDFSTTNGLLCEDLQREITAAFSNYFDENSFRRANIPHCIMFEIFSQLGLDEFSIYSSTCKEWSVLGSRDEVWRGLYHHRFLRSNPDSYCPVSLASLQVHAQYFGGDRVAQYEQQRSESMKSFESRDSLSLSSLNSLNSTPRGDFSPLGGGSGSGKSISGNNGNGNSNVNGSMKSLPLPRLGALPIPLTPQNSSMRPFSYDGDRGSGKFSGTGNRERAFSSSSTKSSAAQTDWEENRQVHTFKRAYYRRLQDPELGDKVEVAWRGKFRLEAMDVYQGLAWWVAEIVDKHTEQGKYKIRYPGWESRWDEWVPRSRLRWAVEKNALDHIATNDVVELWCCGANVPGAWLESRVKKVRGNRYCINRVVTTNNQVKAHPLWVERERLRLVRHPHEDGTHSSKESGSNSAAGGAGAAGGEADDGNGDGESQSGSTSSSRFSLSSMIRSMLNPSTASAASTASTAHANSNSNSDGADDTEADADLDLDEEDFEDDV